MDDSSWSVRNRGPVAVLTLEKPPANVIDYNDLVELGEKMAVMRGAPEVRAVMITGGSGAFISGTEMGHMTTTPTPALQFELLSAQRLIADIEGFEKPVVAAIGGNTLGGGLDIALACDMRVCSENANFGQIEINVGLLPGWGSVQRLTKTVGTARARDLILTGRIISAEEALVMGLVSQMVPAPELESSALALAGLLASRPPVAFALAKEMLGAAAGDAGTNPVLEALSSAVAAGTNDAREGLAALFEGREPQFRGD